MYLCESDRKLAQRKEECGKSICMHGKRKQMREKCTEKTSCFSLDRISRQNICSFPSFPPAFTRSLKLRGKLTPHIFPFLSLFSSFCAHVRKCVLLFFSLLILFPSRLDTAIEERKKRKRRIRRREILLLPPDMETQKAILGIQQNG